MTKAQKGPGGRPTKYDPAYCQALIDHMSGGASVLSFAAEIDVARSTINEWAENHAEFSEALSRGKAKCAAWWERLARINAATGQGNATLTVFGLKNMSDGEWADKAAVDHTSSDGSMTPVTGFDVRIAGAPSGDADKAPG